MQKFSVLPMTTPKGIPKIFPSRRVMSIALRYGVPGTLHPNTLSASTFQATESVRRKGGIASSLAPNTPTRCGTEYTIVATADDGYEFIGWYDESGAPRPGLYWESPCPIPARYLPQNGGS